MNNRPTFIYAPTVNIINNNKAPNWHNLLPSICQSLKTIMTASSSVCLFPPQSRTPRLHSFLLSCLLLIFKSMNFWTSFSWFYHAPRRRSHSSPTLFFHLISSLLSESARRDVRWQCGPWRLDWKNSLKHWTGEPMPLEIQCCARAAVWRLQRNRPWREQKCSKSRLQKFESTELTAVLTNETHVLCDR